MFLAPDNRSDAAVTDVKLEILDYLKNLDDYHLLLVLSFLQELLD